MSTQTVPKELSDYVNERQDRFSSLSNKAKNLIDIVQMFVRGSINILKKYVKGERKPGYYGKLKKETVPGVSNLEMVKHAFSTIGKPMALSFDLTSRCNYACRDCFKKVLDTHGEATPEISDELFLDRLEYVYKSFPGVPTFIMGGEPTLQPKRLVRALELAKESGSPVKISSNSSIDIVEKAKRDENYGRLLEVLKDPSYNVTFLCSLEDTVAEHHDRIRRQGGYELSIGNAKKLIKAGVPVTGNLFIHAKNYNRFDQMLDDLRDMEFDRTYVSFHTYVPRAGDRLEDYVMTEQHRANASDKIADVLSQENYGYFTRGMTPKVARMFHPDNLSRTFSLETCPTPTHVLSFDHRMRPLNPCSFGGEVSCNTEHDQYGKIGCGLWVPALYKAALRGEPGAIKNLMVEAFK